MTRRTLRGLMLFLVLMTSWGCGFGGFEDKSTTTGSDGTPGSGADTKLFGVVSKGLFQGGAVEVYAVGGSGEETLLKRSSIDAFGNYSANLGTSKVFDGSSYTGVVLIKASGSYLDEATGTKLSVTPESPLRAAITHPSGNVTAMVTPLTEIAVRKALESSGGGALAASTITEANALVSQLFKVDIIATQPVAPDLSDTGFGNAATSQQQKDYTLALAAISRLAKESGLLSSTLGSLDGAISSGTMSLEGALSFRRALDDFLASELNLTGIGDSRLTNLTNVGGRSAKVKIKIVGNLEPGASVNGITLSLNLPAGVVVKGDFTVPDLIGTLDGAVSPSGVAASGSYLEGRYLPASTGVPARVKITLAHAAGFALGEVITVTCELPPGATPQPGDFTVSEAMFKDKNGATLSSVGIEVPLTLE